MSDSSASATALPSAVVEELERLAKRYPTREALLLPALHLAQRHWGGWLPENAIDAVARYLDLAPAKVYGVVSFYDLYYDRPVGRHRISVCNNLPCILRGATEILETVGEELGVGENEVTPDGRCSYVHFECLGSCDTAPMMMVDDHYHENLTPDKVRDLLRTLD
jgi:NADH-quinone oxidoreductase subunit E